MNEVDITTPFLQYGDSALLSSWAPEGGDGSHKIANSIGASPAPKGIPVKTARQGGAPPPPLAVRKLRDAKGAARRSYRAANNTPGGGSSNAAVRNTMAASCSTTSAASVRQVASTSPSLPYEGDISQQPDNSHKRAAAVLPRLMWNINDAQALLNTIFPPVVEDDATTSPGGGVPSGFVSTKPASREEVSALHAALRSRLELRRAQPDGICAIRRAIYDDLFAELVRQTTIEEPARGVLLERVRVDAMHSLQVQAELLSSGEAFATQKFLQSTEGSDALHRRLENLRREKSELEARRHALGIVRVSIEHRLEEERQALRKQQHDELNYLRRANQQLSLRLKIETERATAAGAASGARNSASGA